ncbi:hypothetical protein D9Q98_003447 [Chlorella vulgaris]|uniref:Probable cytosolic iron-sulfur protein assembly protein CIAO1 homolog n=1 Tax=Chlorella vulgaris TaxID=3077 RepID=A0A9D4YYS9_CHLVU|nr:hypothetical protein D9Q98_003447 [Chlorella vulgaris]
MGSLEELQCLQGHSDRVWQVSWSPSGDMLASCGGDRTVRIWRHDAANPERWLCTAILEDTHSRTIRSACWSPCGRFLATASFDRTTAVWQHQGGVWEVVAMLEGHESEVKEVAWNPNGGMLATCSRDKTVWLWEVQPGHEYEVVDVKHGHSQDVKTVRWHPLGEVLVSASYDDTIKLWVEEDDEWVCAQTLAEPGVGHASTVWEVAFDAVGERMVSCSDDCTLKIWGCCRADSGEQQWTLLSTLSGFHDRTIFSVDWSKQGLIASGCADNAIRIFGQEGGGEQDQVDSAAATPGVWGLFMQQDSSRRPATGSSSDKASSSSDSGVATFRLLSTRQPAHPLDVNCVRWHPTDPTLLASAGDDCCIKLWRWHAAPT